MWTADFGDKVPATGGPRAECAGAVDTAVSSQLSAPTDDSSFASWPVRACEGDVDRDLPKFCETRRTHRIRSWIVGCDSSLRCSCLRHRPCKCCFARQRDLAAGSTRDVCVHAFAESVVSGSRRGGIFRSSGSLASLCCQADLDGVEFSGRRIRWRALPARCGLEEQCSCCFIEAMKQQELCFAG